MKITIKGQVTIPAEVRERLGLLPNTEVDIVVENGHAVVRKRHRSRRRGTRAIEALRGRGTVPMSTDEILTLTRGE